MPPGPGLQGGGPPPSLRPGTRNELMALNIADKRARACRDLLTKVHSITGKEGITPSALHSMKKALVALAAKTELFPLSALAMPVADNAGHGLYLTINLPGKEAAPHDHGIWCVNAAVSGRERHIFYRRTDDGGTAGSASVIKVGEVMVEPGNGMAMADHDIHSTEVIGKEPAIGLALYGYALARFPAVAWFHP